MSILALLIIVVDVIIIIVLIPTIILQRRESGATLAWMVTIVLLPYIGLILFWVFGTTRLHLRRRKRHRVEKQISRNLKNIRKQLSSSAELSGFSVNLLNLATKLDGIGPRRNNDIKLFRSGKTAFDEIVASIETAKDHIHLIYYIWQPDSTGKRVRNALITASKRGVMVRLLIDDLGSYDTQASFFKPLVDSGGEIERFLPITPFSQHFKLNNRNHRKIIVIDGKVGFTGGMNIGDDYAGLGEPWIDLHAKITGLAVYSLQEIFCQDWYQTTACDLTNKPYFPKIENKGNTWVQVLSSGPADERWKNIHTLLFASINMAQKTIWIETPYFVPDPPIVMALQTAALSGVDVRLLLPSKSDNPLALHAGRSFLDELMHAGVRVFEVQNAMPHAKMVTIDGVFSTMGSANMDQRSFRLNFETNLFFYGKEVAKEMERDFISLCNQQAKELCLKERKNIKGLQRLAEGIGRVLAPLL